MRLLCLGPGSITTPMSTSRLSRLSLVPRPWPASSKPLTPSLPAPSRLQICQSGHIVTGFCFYVYVCVCVCVHVGVYVCVCVYASMCVCV